MQRLSLARILTLVLYASLLAFHCSSAFSLSSVPGTVSTSSSLLIPPFSPSYNKSYVINSVASKCSSTLSFLHSSASRSRLPSILTAIADRETASSDITDYGRIFPRDILIVEPKTSLLGGSDCNEEGYRRDKHNNLDKDEQITCAHGATSEDDHGENEEEGSNAQDSHETNNAEVIDDEEEAKRRTKAAMLTKLARNSSSSSRSRKNISESKERRGNKETSVGKRKVGSASKARSRGGGVGNLLGSVRTSAAAAAALKQKKKDNGSNSSSSLSKDQSPDSETKIITSHEKSIVSTINDLIDVQDDAKHCTKQPSMGILGEKIYYNHPHPELLVKFHQGPQQKQKQQQQISMPTLPEPGTIIMQQKQQLARHSLLTKQYLRKHFSINVAGQSDYAAIAQLRLSVYGGDSIAWKKEWIDRTCKILNQRRLKGITCLTACVNYVDARPWLIGSIECSTHEFEGTELGKSRPQGTILYITEVAVSNRVRRSGIGLSLLKAMDKIAALRNVETLYLHVDVENIAARSLYEKTGYEVLDPKNKMYAEFTRKLNLHNEGTTGRHHYLMCKKLTDTQTWYHTGSESVDSKSQRGIIGFDVSRFL